MQTKPTLGVREECYDTWEQCEHRLIQLQDSAPSLPLSGHETLFRGHRRSSWGLNTTLERRIGSKVYLGYYYNIVKTAHPEIEGLGASQFGSDRFPDFHHKEDAFDDDGLELFQSGIPNQDYLVFLRHHGFPSPLLDWTRSPYIAAFFAYREAEGADDEQVAIFVLLDKDLPFGIRTRTRPEQVAIARVGPEVRTHRRHFLQQGAYTYCYSLLYDGGIGLRSSWNFVPHEGYFSSEHADSYELYKISCPRRERLKVLHRLDQLNLNPYSLLGTLDSLMEAISLRAIEYQQRLVPAHIRRLKTDNLSKKP